MANTPTREHRERAVEILRLMAHANAADLIAAALCDAEQHGYERGLADRDERCLQSDMQRIREKLAYERGRETESAEVVAYLLQYPSDYDYASAIESGKHLVKEE